jgi:hypothetical protein
MTAEGSAAGALAPPLERSALEAVSVSTVLGLCDKAVGEAGRRAHAFGWLRLPDAQAGQWLTVDAYYPVNRLVVLCRYERQAHDGLIHELIPKHGLRLLELDPTELGGRREFVEASLVRLIGGLGPPPAPVHAAPAPARARTAPAPSSSDQIPLGVLLGVGLVAATFVEVFVGVIEFGLDGGHLLIACGLALDACARTLGTVAACQSGRPGWAWACALGGSPFVVSFAYLQSDGPVTVDPAPVAGLVGTAAGFVLLVAIAAAMLGI